MKNINKGRFATIVAGAAVLAVFGGGTAVAGSLITSAQIKDSTIVGKDVKNSGLTGSDVKSSSLTGYDIKNGTLSNSDINVFNVSAKEDGTIVTSSGGGITVNHFTEGGYRITFPRNIQSCSVVATPASPAGYFPPFVNMSVADVINEPAQVLVGVRNMNDNNDPQDAGFHAVVVC